METRLSPMRQHLRALHALDRAEIGLIHAAGLDIQIGILTEHQEFSVELLDIFLVAVSQPFAQGADEQDEQRDQPDHQTEQQELALTAPQLTQRQIDASSNVVYPFRAGRRHIPQLGCHGTIVARL